MNGEKWIRKSKVLNRSFHADVFISKTKPKGIVLWLGGSGMDKNKYNSRGKSINTIFENTWNRLGHDLPIIFIFVTAPYDIRFANFADFPEDKNRWNEHIESEILNTWQDLPVYLIGNSGGAALALNGIHRMSRVVGAGCMGADNIPENFEVPLDKSGEPVWRLRIYYNWDDLVYNKNESIIDNLIKKDFVEPPIGYEGEHCTKHYIENRSFDGLIKTALEAFNN